MTNLKRARGRREEPPRWITLQWTPYWLNGGEIDLSCFGLIYEHPKRFN